jgi:hypothetical protein
VVIVAICLVTLTPAVSPALRAGVARGERALLGHSHAISWLKAQVSMHLPQLYTEPLVTEPGGSGGGSHTYWQVGVMAGPDASDATGMRTSITTRLPQTVAAQTTNYYWIGSYLDDGSFVQAGYFVSWSDPSDAGWFYCSFNAAGTEGPCVYGPEGSAGADGTTHTYALEAAPTSATNGGADGTDTGGATWAVYVDGAAAGQFAWSSGNTGDNSPSAYAESSGFAPHQATSRLGPVDFPAPIAARPDGQTAYVPADHLRPVYSASDVCPPYGADADGQGGVLLGSGLDCPSAGQWLW